VNAPRGAAGGPRSGTHARIVDAAAGLYLAKGDASTTIDEIAAAADLSPSSVYRHFGGKRELEEAMVDEALTRAESLLVDARRAASPMQRVRGAGAAYFRVAVEFPVAMRLFAARGYRSDGSRPAELFDASVTARTREMIISVAADIRQAMDAGEIPPGRVADAMLFLWGPWSGVIGLMVRRDELAVDAPSAARALDLGHHALIVALAQARTTPPAANTLGHLQHVTWERVSPPPGPAAA
jgi:AcrR family transcriptional regulator